MNNNNNNKKAKKRRVRHDLPGPAGSYFRRQRPQKMPTKKEVVDNNGHSSRRQSQSLAIVTSSPTILNHDPNSPPPESSGTQSQSQQQQQQRQAFHDHASDLHECNAWNMMCVGLDRIVPRPDHTTATILSSGMSSYKNILRTNISNEYALIHELHEGKYDIVTDCGGGGGGGNNNIDIEKTTSQELRLPLLVGYVATIHCHDHSDWTALLVDEMHGAAASNTNRSSIGSSGKGVVCWIEEKLVKRHPNWVRPGCVWCIEGAKLALFASDTTCDDAGEIHDVVGGSIETCSTRHATNTVLDIPSNILGNTHDISPSTESARGGGQIDRMILIGEYCMVHAWTPEEASSASFGHDEFINLMERRLGLGLPDKKMCSIELIDDGDDNGACILGRTNISDRNALTEELGDAGSRNHNTDSSLNEFAHTSKQLKSGLSTASPVTASDRSFAAATTKFVQLIEQCNDHVESIRCSSPPIINVLGQPHGENASIPSPRVVLASLPFPHVEEGNADCNDGSDESKFCGKSIVTEGLLVVQSTDCGEALCKEQQDKMIENVGQSARDNVELLRITPPRGASLPTPTTTTSAKKNSGSYPPVNANATAPRSVSCETASSVSCDNIINDNNQNLQQCKAPSEQKYVNTFDDDDDVLDDELLTLDTTAFAAVQAQSCSTPKAASNKQQMYSQQLRMDTRDSFDYMLDEDDDNSCPGVPAAGVLQGLIKPISDCPDNKIKSSSNPTIPVVTRGASLFDSLDGDDLDFLNEDE